MRSHKRTYISPASAQDRLLYDSIVLMNMAMLMTHIYAGAISGIRGYHNDENKKITDYLFNIWIAMLALGQLVMEYKRWRVSQSAFRYQAETVRKELEKTNGELQQLGKPRHFNNFENIYNLNTDGSSRLTDVNSVKMLVQLERNKEEIPVEVNWKIANQAIYSRAKKLQNILSKLPKGIVNIPSFPVQDNGLVFINSYCDMPSKRRIFNLTPLPYALFAYSLSHIFKNSGFGWSTALLTFISSYMLVGYGTIKESKLLSDLNLHLRLDGFCYAFGDFKTEELGPCIYSQFEERVMFYPDNRTLKKYLQFIYSGMMRLENLLKETDHTISQELKNEIQQLMLSIDKSNLDAGYLKMSIFGVSNTNQPSSGNNNTKLLTKRSQHV